MTSTTSMSWRAAGGPRRGAFLTLMALIAAWVLPQIVVGLGTGTLTVDGRAEYAEIPLDPLAGVSAGLTLLMVVVGLLAERRGDRRRARTFRRSAPAEPRCFIPPRLPTRGPRQTPTTL